MLGRLSTLLLGSTLAITTSVKAEQKLFPVLLPCNTEPSSILNLVQDKYEELPFATAQGLVQSQDGEWFNGLVIQTVNPETRTFSVIWIDPQSGAECMVTTGKDFTPAGMSKMDNINYHKTNDNGTKPIFSEYNWQKPSPNNCINSKYN